MNPRQNATHHVSAFLLLRLGPGFRVGQVVIDLILEPLGPRVSVWRRPEALDVLEVGHAEDDRFAEGASAGSCREYRKLTIKGSWALAARLNDRDDIRTWPNAQR